MEDIEKSDLKRVNNVLNTNAKSSYLHHDSSMRPLSDIQNARFDDENHPTSSSEEQENVEKRCLKLFENFFNGGNDSSFFKNAAAKNSATLERSKTLNFLRKGLEYLSTAYEGLDSSRPWILYWILHSMELLDDNLTDSPQIEAIINFLGICQNPEGGFGGGPGQISHLAPTYAAVNVLCILGTKSAYSIIDRQKLVLWMNKLRLEDGSFLMHEDGEVDIRGVYCALSVVRLTNTYSPELFKNTAKWVLSCQTYEGGFGGAPGMEAHGGYSFCGFASLIMLGKGSLCDIENLLRWSTNRQMGLEGGFQGRTNKLVDGCYSFWQGGIFPLLRIILLQETELPKGLLFNVESLQEYLLICCQDARGGLIDKPGKSRDFYHTCYTLSGLSVAQCLLNHNDNSTNEMKKRVLGHHSNELKETHPLHNICIDRALAASNYFNALPVPKCEVESL